MSGVHHIDNLIADQVREFEIEERRHHRIDADDFERVLTETLGAKTKPAAGEVFSVGDAMAGITSRSVWYQFRRIHFAVIASIAVGELRNGGRLGYALDVNCTLRRSYRFVLSAIPETDNFLVALSQFTSFKLVPTIEDDLRAQRAAEEISAIKEANSELAERRMQSLARQQNELLSTLIQVECAPRISFGVLY
jgi:hypothetical protein